MSFDQVELKLRRSPIGRARFGRRPRRAAVERLLAMPEPLVVAGVLNLWNLQINGVANTCHVAAVKAMASSWHDFLYNAMDSSGLMRVDKPPLADWIQALSVRVFGWSSWSMLAP